MTKRKKKKGGKTRRGRKKNRSNFKRFTDLNKKFTDLMEKVSPNFFSVHLLERCRLLHHNPRQTITQMQIITLWTLNASTSVTSITVTINQHLVSVLQVRQVRLWPRDPGTEDCQRRGGDSSRVPLDHLHDGRQRLLVLRGLHPQWGVSYPGPPRIVRWTWLFQMDCDGGSLCSWQLWKG